MDGRLISRNDGPGTVRAGFQTCPNSLCKPALLRISGRHRQSLFTGFVIEGQSLLRRGVFLFNIEHPVFTSGVHQDWIYGEDGKPKY